jgi:hypothetical protein
MGEISEQAELDQQADRATDYFESTWHTERERDDLYSQIQEAMLVETTPDTPLRDLVKVVARVGYVWGWQDRHFAGASDDQDGDDDLAEDDGGK